LQITIENIVVLINSDRINVTDEKTSCSYDVFLPYILDANGAEAFFDYNIGVRIFSFSFHIAPKDLEYIHFLVF